MDTCDVRLLRRSIQLLIPPSRWTPWPGGWPGEIDAALIDAVFSIRARYGRSEKVGVRRVVHRWREHVQPCKADDLSRLAEYVTKPDDLAEILGSRQTLLGGKRLKAQAVAEAADALAKEGCRQSATLRDTPELKVAYTKVPGLGHVTWSYLLMLGGSKDRVKADTMLRRFTGFVLERKVSADEAGRLVTAVAEQLGVHPRSLDHAVWAYERDRKEPELVDRVE